MSDSRCPNCRKADLQEDQGCPKCGWLPLRSTELQFLDEEIVTCPSCHTQREAIVSCCPHCGNDGVLQPLVPGRVTFHISTLLAITTMVAVCAAIFRFTMVGGVLVSTVLGLSVFRVALLLRERKKYDYPPITTSRLAELFGCSLGGVLLAPVIFFAVSLAGGMLISLLLMMFYQWEMLSVLLVLIVGLAGNSGLTYWICRPRFDVWAMVLGVLHATSIASLLLATLVISVGHAEWLIAATTAGGTLSFLVMIVFLASWRGSKAPLLVYVSGHQFTLNLLALLYMGLA